MPLTTHFDNAVFRYRSIDALLGKREELQRQTIFFPPPDALNDPMEGLRQMFWRGDRITWRNLLRHYVGCLHNRVIEALLTEDGERLDKNTISVHQTLDNYPTPLAAALCRACIDAVEAGGLHAALLDFLSDADCDIGSLELNRLLRMVHLDWLDIIYAVFQEHGLIPDAIMKARDPSPIIEILKRLKSVMPQVRSTLPARGVEAIQEIQHFMTEEMALVAAAGHAHPLGAKRESLILEFTSQYLDGLLKLVYPEWYVACFSARHDNASMWSHYASNHTGCCLVFRKHEEDAGPKIRLSGPRGYSGDGIQMGRRDFDLDAVHYAVEEQRIEFFTSIGRLPMATVMREWFGDDEGNISPLADHLNADRHDAWRSSYWERYLPPLLRKLPDWEHEQELRILLTDGLGIHRTPEGRTFTYDYDVLDGIIFGINTSLSEKVRIMRIVEPKLSGRTVQEPFRFYQAYYSAGSGRIEARLLNLRP